MTISGETLQAMNLDDACRYLGYWGTGNGDMRATKEVVRQKIIAARDLIKCHPLTPELATELFTSNGMGVFRFSAALHQKNTLTIQKFLHGDFSSLMVFQTIFFYDFVIHENSIFQPKSFIRVVF